MDSVACLADLAGMTAEEMSVMLGDARQAGADTRPLFSST